MAEHSPAWTDLSWELGQQICHQTGQFPHFDEFKLLLQIAAQHKHFSIYLI